MMVGQDIQVINDKVAQSSAFVERLMGEIGKVIVGQVVMVVVFIVENLQVHS